MAERKIHWPWNGSRTRACCGQAAPWNMARVPEDVTCERCRKMDRRFGK